MSISITKKPKIGSTQIVKPQVTHIVVTEPQQKVDSPQEKPIEKGVTYKHSVTYKENGKIDFITSTPQ